jgi:hypothetical protein
MFVFMKEESILSVGSDEMMQRHIFVISLMIRLPDPSERERRCHFGRKERLVLYTDCSKTNEDTEAGMCGYGT